jgi:hypothetical protein
LWHRAVVVERLASFAGSASSLGPARLTATHSAFVVERATSSCCLEVKMTAPPLSMTTSPNCDRLVVVYGAQFEYETTLLSSVFCFEVLFRKRFP